MPRRLKIKVKVNRGKNWMKVIKKKMNEYRIDEDIINNMEG